MVASRVPTWASSRSEQPAIRGQRALQKRAAHLLAAWHIPRCGGHRHAALDQADQVVDLPGVVTPVGHRHYRYRRGCGVDPEPDRVGRARAVGVDQAADPRLFALRKPLPHGKVRVLASSTTTSTSHGQPDQLKQPVEDDMIASPSL